MEPDRGYGDMTAQRLGGYAIEISRRIRRDFEINYPVSGGRASRTFTLRVAGVPEDRTKDFQEKFRSITGVKDVLRPRFDRSFGTSYIVLDLRYAGDSFDLRHDRDGAPYFVLFEDRCHRPIGGAPRTGPG